MIYLWKTTRKGLFHGFELVKIMALDSTAQSMPWQAARYAALIGLLCCVDYYVFLAPSSSSSTALATVPRSDNQIFGSSMPSGPRAHYSQSAHIDETSCGNHTIPVDKIVRSNRTDLEELLRAATRSSFHTADVSPWRRLLAKPPGSLVRVVLIAVATESSQQASCAAEPHASFLCRVTPALSQTLSMYSLEVATIWVGNDASPPDEVGQADLVLLDASGYFPKSLLLIRRKNNFAFSNLGAALDQVIARTRGAAIVVVMPTLADGKDALAFHALALEAIAACLNRGLIVVNLFIGFIATPDLAITKRTLQHSQGDYRSRSQALLVDLSALVVSQAYMLACLGTLPTEYAFAKTAAYSSCGKAAISAYAPPSHWRLGNTTADGGWVFMEDRPRRPGWICVRPGANLTFEVGLLPAKSHLVLSFLRTYSPMGDAEVYVTRYNNTNSGPNIHQRKQGFYRLRGTWERNYSVASNVALLATKGFRGFNMPRGTVVNVTLACHANGNATKFKLISISVC